MNVNAARPCLFIFRLSTSPYSRPVTKPSVTEFSATVSSVVDFLVELHNLAGGGVDFKFIFIGAGLEFEINASTGEIVKFDKEIDD